MVACPRSPHQDEVGIYIIGNVKIGFVVREFRMLVKPPQTLSQYSVEDKESKE
jgi:hypothetical protein